MNKSEQRAHALAARRALGAERRRAYSAAVCDRLAKLPELRGAKIVLSYMALDDEPDLAALHEWLRSGGARPVFPVSGAGGQMTVWDAGGWRRGAYGILEPDPAVSRPIGPEEIDLVLAPCVAFDEDMGRLGHGAGYYDRYLPLTRCPVVAAAFEAQKLGTVVCGAHDRRMDAVVTEKNVYRSKKA